jgi:FkbM family methyltransferase
MENSLFISKVLRKLKIIQKGYLKFFSFTLRKNINGNRFRIPIINNVGWNNVFDNEPWMNRILEILSAERKGIFIDVGANIGQTLLKIRGISMEMTYYGFEANPACLFYLNRLIEVNHFRNTYIIPVGLSDNSGLASLNFFSRNPDDATATILENLRPGATVQKKEYVYLTRLDELAGAFPGGISVLKIDVEGAEPEVLKGAIETIRKHRPVIIIEILPAYSAENKWRVDRHHQLEEFALSTDYRIFRIEKDNKNNILSFLPVKKLEINANIQERDFMLLPVELNMDFSPF